MGVSNQDLEVKADRMTLRRIRRLPADMTGTTRKCLDTGKNGIVVDTLADERTIIRSFIPIVKNDSGFAHAFELTLFLDLHEKMLRMGGLSRESGGSARPTDPGRLSRPRRPKERIHGDRDPRRGWRAASRPFRGSASAKVRRALVSSHTYGKESPTNQSLQVNVGLMCSNGSYVTMSVFPHNHLHVTRVGGAW